MSCSDRFGWHAGDVKVELVPGVDELPDGVLQPEKKPKKPEKPKLTEKTE